MIFPSLSSCSRNEHRKGSEGERDAAMRGVTGEKVIAQGNDGLGSRLATRLPFH